MFVARLSLFVILCATRLAAADSPTWSRSTMTAAASYFPAGSQVMVVGVGDTAQPVVAALVETLQASDGFEFVIDAKGLGKLDGLADADIVHRAFGRPLKRLAIVRVFPAGGSVKAVVTIYGAQGQVTTAFTLAPGKNLAENPTPEAAGDGVRSDEMQVVKSATGSSEDGDDIRYERQAVTGMTAYGVFTLENVNFFKNGKLISDTPELYDALGMTDKAADYRSKQENHRKWATRGIILDSLGTTGLIAFGTWALVSGGTEYDVRTGAEVQRSNTLQWGLTAASAGVIVIGSWMIAANSAPTPLTSDQAISLVDAHNAKKRHAAARSELHFVPSATPSGGGLVVMGSF